MPLTITTITAALLTILYVVLALRVINLRRTGVGPSVGTGENEQFVRAVRAHGNLGEYAPLFLILLGLYEAQGGHYLITTAVAATFVVGRLLHAIGFGLIGRGPGRTLGMVLTNTALLSLAGLCLWLVL